VKGVGEKKKDINTVVENASIMIKGKKHAFA